MTDRNDRGERGGDRLPAEGVRIIRAEEAQAALEAGAAAGRRPDDELRFGDVPPAPSGPRPAHRFPLPTTVDPAEVPHPPVAFPARAEDRNGPATSVEPTGSAWEPPPAWDPPTRRRVPAWDSPLDDAEGIVPAPTSWVPPEAWATSARTFRPDPPTRPPGGSNAQHGQPAPAGDEWDVPDAEVGEPDRSDFAEPMPIPAWEPPTAVVPIYSDEGPRIDEPATTAGELSGTPSPGFGTAEPPVGWSGVGDPSTARSHASAQSLTPDVVPPAPPNEGNAMTGGFGTDLPHWTDPPTGEVPHLRPEDHDSEEPDDIEAWKAVGQDSGVRWRDEANDWSDIGGIDELGSDETRVGALDSSRAEHSDLYSFDEDFERLDEERSGRHRVFTELDSGEIEAVAPERVSSAPRASSAARAAARGARSRTSGPLDRGEPPDDGRDLTSAVFVGAGLVVLLIIGYIVGSKGLLVLSAAVVIACCLEAFAMVQRRGFKPATLLGLAGAAGVVFGAYWRGIEALTIITAIVFIATMLWYLLGVVDARPVANVSATLMIYLWVGFLGSFAGLLLRAPHGKGLFLGAVLPTVAADVGAYVIGSRLGSRTLAPDISPGKTVEGVIAGGVAALIVGAIVGSRITPWGGVKHGLLLGLVVAVLAPVGDLFESMIKRDLGLKDSGSALPGHGGLLDRFDSLLIVLPAAYYLASLFNLHV